MKSWNSLDVPVSEYMRKDEYNDKYLMIPNYDGYTNIHLNRFQCFTNVMIFEMDGLRVIIYVLMLTIINFILIKCLQYNNEILCQKILDLVVSIEYLHKCCTKTLIIPEYNYRKISTTLDLSDDIDLISHDMEDARLLSVIPEENPDDVSNVSVVY